MKKKPPIQPLPAELPPSGWYRLTAEVLNPAPDGRRANELSSRPSWPAGTVFYLKHRERYSTADFLDGSGVNLRQPSGRPSLADWDREECQGNGLLYHLAPLPLNLGRLLEHSYATPAQLLAALVGLRKISLEELQAIDYELRQLEPEAFAAFDAQHKKGATTDV